MFITYKCNKYNSIEDVALRFLEEYIYRVIKKEKKAIVNESVIDSVKLYFINRLGRRQLNDLFANI